MRDFVYVDDLLPALEGIVAEARWNETLTLASGVATPLRRAAELVRDAAGSDSPIETPGGALEPGENLSYERGQRGSVTRLWRPPPRGSYSSLCRLAPPPSRSSRPLRTLSR